MSKTLKAKLIPGRSLVAASYRDYTSGWKFYLGASALVNVPVRLLGLSATLAADKQFQAFVAVASIVMNLALLFIARRRAQDQAVSLRAAYYDGTAYFVRFILVSAVVALALTPALFGIVLFAAGSSTGAAAGELVVVGGLGLLLSLPSLWLLVRLVLSTIIAATEDCRPTAALKQSRTLTLGYFWQMAGRLASLLLVLLGIAAIGGVVVTGIGLFVHSTIVIGSIFDSYLGLTALPFASIYLTKLYLALVQVKTR